MKERGDIAFTAFPSADGEHSDAQDFGENALTVVIFLSPFLEVIGFHGVSIIKY